MTPSRFELKPLLEFLKQEFREKRPKGIDLVLVKQRAVLTRGPLPEFQLRATPGSRHLVVEDLGPEHRVYFFAENGVMVGGVNVPTDSTWLTKLWKGSRSLYHLPKKVLELRPEQLAESEYQRFVKVYAHLASLWGARPEPPLLPIVAMPTYPVSGLHLGATGEDKIRHVSLEAIQSPEGPFILAREAFRSFVPEGKYFLNEQDADIIVNYLATIFSGAANQNIFAKVWENNAIAPLLSRVQKVLPERSKQDIDKYLRAIAGATGLLGKIGEKLSPAAIVIYIKGLITDFLEGRGGRNERLLVSYYTNLLEDVRNARDTPQTILGDAACKALLAFASFAPDLKLTHPPDIEGIGEIPLLDAVRSLRTGKYQALVNYLDRDETRLSPPINALARMAIAAQIRAGGVTFEFDEIPPLTVNTPHSFEVRLCNATDLLLYNVDLSISPHPSGRLHVGDLQREGPVDLHYKLLFRVNIIGITAGAATLEIQANMNHPCSHEKRIVLQTRAPITIS